MKVGNQRIPSADAAESLTLRVLHQDIYWQKDSPCPGSGHPFLLAERYEPARFWTINTFRSSKAKEVIEVLFSSMLVFLMEHKYIKMEHYFCDGSPFMADANKHKMVWKKNALRY